MTPPNTPRASISSNQSSILNVPPIAPAVPAAEGPSDRLGEFGKLLLKWAREEPSEYQHAAAVYYDAVMEKARSLSESQGNSEWIIEVPYAGTVPSLPPDLRVSLRAVPPPLIDAERKPEVAKTPPETPPKTPGAVLQGDPAAGELEECMQLITDAVTATSHGLHKPLNVAALNARVKEFNEKVLAMNADDSHKAKMIGMMALSLMGATEKGLKSHHAYIDDGYKIAQVLLYGLPWNFYKEHGPKGKQVDQADVSGVVFDYCEKQESGFNERQRLSEEKKAALTRLNTEVTGALEEYAKGQVGRRFLAGETELEARLGVLVGLICKRPEAAAKIEMLSRISTALRSAPEVNPKDSMAMAKRLCNKHLLPALSALVVEEEDQQIRHRLRAIELEVAGFLSK